MKPANLPCVYLQPSLLCLLMSSYHMSKPSTSKWKSLASWRKLFHESQKHFWLSKYGMFWVLNRNFPGIQLHPNLWTIFEVFYCSESLLATSGIVLCQFYAFFIIREKLEWLGYCFYLILLEKILETPVLSFHRFIRRKNLSDLDNGTHWSKMIFLITSRYLNSGNEDKISARLYTWLTNT